MRTRAAAMKIRAAAMKIRAAAMRIKVAAMRTRAATTTVTAILDPHVTEYTKRGYLSDNPFFFMRFCHSWIIDKDSIDSCLCLLLLRESRENGEGS